jgi:radical SAM superfamily enzyme YgiQ (UPF0313 family)
MKVLLINPKGPSSGYGVGLAYLASVLIENRNEVKVLDFHNKTEKQKTRLKNALKEDWDVIGISINSFTVNTSKRIIKDSKKIKPNVKYIAGGPYVTMKGEEFIKENPEFEIAMCGESEYTILNYLNAIKNNTKLEKVKGIIFRKKGKVIRTPPAELIRNLDELPFPNFKVFDSLDKEIYSYPITSSRGCPYECVFCLNAVLFDRKWRARSPQNIIKELIHTKKEYNIKSFHFDDDNFTLHKERAKKILRLLIKNSKKLDLTFELNNGIRADKIDEELAYLLKKARCKKVGIGIENGDYKTFEYVKKGEKLEDIRKAQMLGLIF